MKTKLLIATTVFCFITCSKDKYTTRPQLKLDGVNGSIFPKGSVLSFTLTATDKEGDLKDTLWIQRISLVCPDLRNDSGIHYELPDYPKKNGLQTKFLVRYNYGNSIPPNIDGCVSKDDSAYFRFWIKDDQNNVSDTVQSPLLILLNN
ncbi:MAG TPA: hypothetical protein VN958_10850 [Chitinophagaceae bacterium]|nr:hypothetical protein [Chitinophagaceae bacterium]